MARIHRRYRKNKKHKSEGGTRRHNPPLLKDMLEYIGPGFAAFAITRFGTRIVATQIAKWKPSWAVHAGAAASVGSFLAAWLLAHKVKWLEKYQAPLMVGSAIAAAQSLIQLYAPNLLGWAVSDATPQLASGSSANSLSSGQTVTMADGTQLQVTDDNPADFTYNDSFDAGRYTGSSGQTTGSATGQAPAAAPAATGDDELLADLDLDTNGGIFAQAGN